MTRVPPPLDEDPPRWADRSPGPLEEDRAGAHLRDARAYAPTARAASHMWPLAPRSRSRSSWLPAARLAVGVAVLLIVGAGLGVAAAAKGWLGFARREAPAPREERLEVEAGGTARLHRAGRWRVALAGPGAATVVDAEVGTVRLSAGTLTVSSEGAPMAIEAGEGTYRLAPGATARVAVSSDGTAQVVSPGAEASAPAPAVEVAPAPAPVEAPAPRRAPAFVPRPPPEVVEPVAPAAAPAPPLAGNADSESAWLGRALKALRRDGDPGRALALLEQHAARFPASPLVAEVAAIRVEALLAGGDEAGALAVLDALAEPALGRRLQITRGELRANAARCAEASRDFSAVLRAVPSDTVDERALRGRAACAAHAHDDAALGRDLALYLERFPDAPFAVEASARLQSLRAAP
jgi:hypothetical protein